MCINYLSRALFRLLLPGRRGGHRLAGWRAAVYRVRRLGIYKATFYVLTHWIFPTAIMFWLLPGGMDA